MGRITVKEAEELRKAGTLSDKTITDLQTRGIISNRTRASKRYIMINGKRVYPTMYFRKLGKKTPLNKDAKALRDEWINILTKHTKKEENNDA